MKSLKSLFDRICQKILGPRPKVQQETNETELLKIFRKMQKAAQDHPTTSDMRKYCLQPGLLSKETYDETQQHVKACKKCQERANFYERNKNWILSAKEPCD